MTRIAVIGPSDAGLRLGVALQAAGAEVVGFELSPAEYVPIPVASDTSEAASADVVLSFVAPHLAEKTAREFAPLLQSGAIYADFSTGTPELKKRLAELFPAHAYADATLPAAGTVEAAGSAAHALFVVLTNLKVAVTVISDVPGDAAARTLIRTLLSNGLAEVVADTLWAAESLGIEEWAWKDIQDDLTSLNADAAQSLIDDAAHNFKRHQIAMQDVVELLASSGYDSTMIAPIQFTHGRIMHGKKIPFSQAPTKKWLK
ncbi:NAD(P)-binding domain-containing protein [Aurantimicrobium minutum]|uniref:NAD(P)-binding domain-containing protein n=1 Tax=Aurantimicrobium minutum TaxID=708131 RepID=UPI0024741903|nr:NAD(P)-binding domain-containing protein [Aurantimicrobium minutum]MDH6536149.1 putative dehydrogenase [Aurantimicrobium minutum]